MIRNLKEEQRLNPTQSKFFPFAIIVCSPPCQLIPPMFLSSKVNTISVTRCRISAKRFTAAAKEYGRKNIETGQMPKMFSWTPEEAQNSLINDSISVEPKARA
jgi:hypothetical protein